jgi:hypothetical protein
MPRVSSPSSLLAATPGLRGDVVGQQLDDLNALAEELVAALGQSSQVQAERVRAEMERRVLAMQWNIEGTRDAVLGYAGSRADGDDELFAPALVLSREATPTPEAAALHARLSDDARTLLAKIGAR